MEQKNFIDIDQVIASKSPTLQKSLPRFIVNYLKRIVHQDEINEILAKHGHKQGAEFVEAVLSTMGVNYSVEGLENLQDNQRYLFASNHPLGGLDGMVLIHLLAKRFDEVKFPVNDLLMHIKPLSSVFIPVNKLGSQSASNAIQLEEAYSSSAQILYFPAGLCSRKQKGRIEDLEWKKNFIVKAIKHERDVVPVFFDGRNSTFFYNLARLRAKLRIKTNIEMLYLSDEMFRQKGKSITVKIGKPIPFSTFDNTRNAHEWAQWVKHVVYQMKPAS